jgi:hypothetical protein
MVPKVRVEVSPDGRDREVWRPVMCIRPRRASGRHSHRRQRHRGQGRESDYFAGDKVWLYVTLLTIGYMVTRGLAKARSRDRSWEERGDRR